MKETKENKLVLDYLDDIMSKANYALMEEEIDYDQWFSIIHVVIQNIKNKYEDYKGVKKNEI